MNDRERKIEAIVTAVVDHGVSESEIYRLSSINGWDSAIVETGLARSAAESLIWEDADLCMDSGNPFNEVKPKQAAALSGARDLVWTEDPCAGCGRPSYTRRDGRSYLYQYSENGPAVCSPRCAHRVPAPVPCPAPSHFSPSDDSHNTKILTLADCGWCGEPVVVR